jgi:hypothetical protein
MWRSFSPGLFQNDYYSYRDKHEDGAMGEISVRSHSRELPHTNMNKALLVHKMLVIYTATNVKTVDGRGGPSE